VGILHGSGIFTGIYKFGGAFYTEHICFLYKGPFQSYEFPFLVFVLLAVDIALRYCHKSVISETRFRFIEMGSGPCCFSCLVYNAVE